jgi:prepilin-type N-terminal cleavage/methylation domain-containing protein
MSRHTARKGSRGFTLIELLVVIAIIATLASIIMAAIMSARTKATSLVTYLTAQQYQHAIQEYMHDHVYPPFAPGIICLGPATATCKVGDVTYTGSALLVSLLAPYMDNFPQPKTADIILSGEPRTSATYLCNSFNTDGSGASTCVRAYITWPAAIDDGKNCISPTFFLDGGLNSYCFFEFMPNN